MNRIVSLLWLLFVAPACAPADDQVGQTEDAAGSTTPLVLLTDASGWKEQDLAAYKDSLGAEGYRVIVSGYRGETAAELTARLPWLLQPGVSLFLYDEQLAGPAGADSLRRALPRLGSNASVLEINH